MSTFRFKQFCVTNERSAMKVNTDGVLLGAAASLRGDEKNVLDAGTGTGCIALQTAQRLSEYGANDFVITGIDIDLPSIEEAERNFAASPWREHLKARHAALQELSTDTKYDLILSNPPYFDNSLQAPDERRNAARHTEVGKSLSYKDLMEFASLHLSDGGCLALILPSDREAALLRYGRYCSLSARRILRIRTVPRKAPARIIVEFTRERDRMPRGDAHHPGRRNIHRRVQKTHRPILYQSVVHFTTAEKLKNLKKQPNLTAGLLQIHTNL